MLPLGRPSYILDSAFCHGGLLGGGFGGGGPGGGGIMEPLAAGWPADGYRGGGGGRVVMMFPMGWRIGGDIGGGGGGTWKGRDGSRCPLWYIVTAPS